MCAVRCHAVRGPRWIALTCGSRMRQTRLSLVKRDLSLVKLDVSSWQSTSFSRVAQVCSDRSEGDMPQAPDSRVAQVCSDRSEGDMPQAPDLRTSGDENFPPSKGSDGNWRAST